MTTLKDNHHARFNFAATLASVAVQYLNDLAPYLQFGVLLMGAAIGWLTISKLRKENRLLERKERDWES